MLPAGNTLYSILFYSNKSADLDSMPLKMGYLSRQSACRKFYSKENKDKDNRVAESIVNSFNN